MSYAGLVIGLGGAGNALGTLIGGIVADKWGRRPAMLGATVPAAITMVSLGLTHNQWVIPALSLLLGTLLGIARPAYGATIVDVVGDKDRARALTLNYWAINIGFSAAMLLAGLLAHTRPILLFTTNATVLLLVGLLIAVKVPETRPVAPVTERPAAIGLGAVFRDRTFVVFVLINLLTWTMIEACEMLPASLTEDGLGATSYGQIIVVNGLMIVVGQLFMPKLIARFRRDRMLAVSALTIGVGFGLVVFADSLWMYMVTVGVWTFGEMLMVPATSALVADLSPPDARGRYQGVASFGFTGATFLGPVGGGLVAQHLGTTTLWLVVAGLGVVVAVANLVVGPARARRVAIMRATSRDRELVAA
ncbi:MFS transporter [Longispora sp. NPDC051575]|uniref:MFS transporter n=1 Tax=Longispora sp. NPDC051575 TaxID=3154943 RepID=UPI00344AEFCC